MMDVLHEVNLPKFHENLFDRLAKDWMLITTEYNGIINSMTASCGMFGNIYPYGETAMIYIRPQRYTNELISKSGTFSLCFFEHKYQDMLRYLGTVSGRDENKIEKCGLTVGHSEGIPYYEEAKLVFLCKKVYVQQMTKESFLDAKIAEKIYPEEDYHLMYMGQILKTLKR